MPKVDRFPNDPFFKRGRDNNWNACIGTQGDEHNYVIGYPFKRHKLTMEVFTV